MILSNFFCASTIYWLKVQWQFCKRNRCEKLILCNEIAFWHSLYESKRINYHLHINGKCNILSTIFVIYHILHSTVYSKITPSHSKRAKQRGCSTTTALSDNLWRMDSNVKTTTMCKGFIYMRLYLSNISPC